MSEQERDEYLDKELAQDVESSKGIAHWKVAQQKSGARRRKKKIKDRDEKLAADQEAFEETEQGEAEAEEEQEKTPMEKIKGQAKSVTAAASAAAEEARNEEEDEEVKGSDCGFRSRSKDVFFRVQRT